MNKLIRRAPPKVLLLISSAGKASRENLSGILAYTRMHTPWHLNISEGAEDHRFVAHIHAWEPDGMIVATRPNNPQTLEMDIPTVIADGDPLQFAHLFKNASHITCDAAAIAKAGADYLIGKGFTSFAYVCDEQEMEWSIRRSKLFRKAIEDAGFNCQIMRGSASSAPNRSMDWNKSRNALTLWLKSLPRQTAIFVSNDVRAREIMEVCQLSGISIPSDLAILGCDNDEILCLNTSPALSSVEPDFHACGYRAAELLEQMMNEACKPPKRLFFGVKVIVERSSCHLRPSGLDTRMSSVLDFIRLNASNKIGVPDVAAHMHASRRSAELLFRKTIGTTIGGEIRTARVEKMKRLLLETTQSVSEICALGGYDSESQAKLAFRKLCGCTMSAYRKQHAP